MSTRVQMALFLLQLFILALNPQAMHACSVSSKYKYFHDIHIEILDLDEFNKMYNKLFLGIF